MESQKSVVMELRILKNLVKRKLDVFSGIIDEDSVTMMHGRTIIYLYENMDKQVFQKDIEQKFDIRRPTASKILKSMENHGLITRHEVDYDARLKKILLTEKAIQLYERMSAKADSFEKMLLKDLTEQEIDTFFKVIDKMKKNIE